MKEKVMQQTPHPPAECNQREQSTSIDFLSINKKQVLEKI